MPKNSNLPNAITLLRILLIPVFIWVFFMDSPSSQYLATALFIILSFSDAIDGYLARRNNQITDLGKILDPIADKFLIISALVILVPRVDLWMVILIISRELIITGARLLFLKKKVIAASMLGKLKTVSQIVAITAALLSLPYYWWLMLIAVIITVVSGIQYLIQMRHVLRSGGKSSNV